MAMGVGTILAHLGGNEESAKAAAAVLGKTISAIAILDEEKTLEICFRDGSRLHLTDEGQSCCEHRYMRSDDDFASILGATLVSLEVEAGGEAVNEKEAARIEYAEVVESEFLRIITDKATVTVVNYVDHNGYYGGFAIRATLFPPEA